MSELVHDPWVSEDVTEAVMTLVAHRRPDRSRLSSDNSSFSDGRLMSDNSLLATELCPESPPQAIGTQATHRGPAVASTPSSVHSSATRYKTPAQLVGLMTRHELPHAALIIENEEIDLETLVSSF